MKKSILYGCVGIVAIVGVSLFFGSQQTSAPSVNNTVAEPAQAATVETDNTRSTPVPGQYVDYREGIIAETPGPKLLFFHADWCRQCRQIEESIKAQGAPKGVSIIKVDYENSDELRAKYKITLQTTFVKIDDQGNEIKKYVAYDEPTINSVRRELLQ